MVMTVTDFKASLSDASAPKDLSLALQALWQDGKGDWHQAHRLAQQADDATGAWVHAYLHRKEGDLDNASYWYRRANKERSNEPLAAEWERIVGALLNATD